MTDTGKADAIEAAADWKSRHDELHKTNLMLIEQLNAARKQLEIQHRRASEKAMAQVEKVITEQMQARLKAYETIRQAVISLPLSNSVPAEKAVVDALTAFNELQQ